MLTLRSTIRPQHDNGERQIITVTGADYTTALKQLDARSQTVGSASWSSPRRRVPKALIVTPAGARWRSSGSSRQTPNARLEVLITTDDGEV